MPQSATAARQRLLRIARSVAARVEVEAGERGVEISLAEERLRFVHSFVSGPVAKRARQSSQLLLKACNGRQRNIDGVLDLTAGWGIDGFILARHGQRVTLLECNPLVHAVVGYAIEQLALDPAGAIVARRMSLELSDAGDFLRGLRADHDYDCIYLDPMFAAHKSGAKPAGEMQILQALTGNSNIESCLELALERARKRVVVKRAAKAPRLSALKPDLVQRAKTIRFDIYLTG